MLTSSAIPDQFSPAPTTDGDRAWALALAGNHGEALEIYQSIARAEPDNLEARWRQADRLINLHRIQEAIDLYTEVRAAAQARLAESLDPESTRLLEDHAIECLMGIRYGKWLLQNPDRLQDPLPVEDHGTSAADRPTTDNSNNRRVANADLNQREFDRGALTLQSLPTDLYLESTTKCNFYCQTCSKGYNAYFAEDLHDDIFDHVRENLMPVNKRISITGFGEPTLSGKFDRMLSMAVDNGSHVHFVTNASLLSIERLHQITRLPVLIMISFDGGTAETFEAVRQGGNFALTLERLAMIRKMRNIHLSAAKSVFVFNCVALRRNAPELVEIVRIAHRFQISSIGVTDYFFNYNEFDTESLRYDPELANRCFREALDEAGRLGVALSLPPYFDAAPPPLTRASVLDKLRTAFRRRILPVPNRFPNKCTSPWREPYIRNNGIVSMCCLTSDAMGNLKTHSFQQIWNNWRYRLLRWRINTPLPPPTCRNCFIHWGINGGNPANVKAQEGLLIKAWYKGEAVITEWLPALFGRLRKRVFPAPAAEPPPNYEKGRPIRDKSKAGV